MSKKTTWGKALFTFFSPIVFLLTVRWVVIEPFVIPSESMVPTLLVHDHIFVIKSAFGFRWPFSDDWVVWWSPPKRGDIVVFRYPKNQNMFFVKRLIGLPGDKIEWAQGRVKINGEWLNYSNNENQIWEDIENKKHIVRVNTEFDKEQNTESIDVPESSYFVMGDNRNNSSDSRVWGFVPQNHLVGSAWMIWLSCDETLESASYLCDPTKIRWNRLFKKL